MIKWIKNNWKQIWIGGLGGLITSLLLSIIGLIYSGIEQIPFIDLFKESLNNYIRINYFTLILCAILLLSMLISVLYLILVRAKLKKIKFPLNLKTNQFDLQDFLKGQWSLDYTNSSLKTVREYITFVNGNQYYIGDNLTFILKDILYKENKKELKWTKIKYSNNEKHSVETLRIIDAKTITGIDDIGYILNYKKKDLPPKGLT